MRHLPSTIETPAGPTVEGANPALLAELLGELESTVIAAGGTTAALNTGLAPEELDAMFATRGTFLPEELKVWFGWHNGEKAEEPQFCLPFALLKVEDSFRMRDLEDAVGDPRWDWDPQWLRLTGDWNAGGAIQCRDKTSPPLVRIVADETRTHPSDISRQLVSLCTPVTWWIDAIRSGYYQWGGLAWSRVAANGKPQRIRTAWM